MLHDGRKPMRIFTGSLYSIRQWALKLMGVWNVCREAQIREMKLNVMVSRGKADKNPLWEDGRNAVVENWPYDCLPMTDGCDMVLRSKIGDAVAGTAAAQFRTCRAAESLAGSICCAAAMPYGFQNGIENLNLFASLRV
jgi:hypothetical protein